MLSKQTLLELLEPKLVLSVPPQLKALASEGTTMKKFQMGSESSRTKVHSPKKDIDNLTHLKMLNEMTVGK